MINYLLAVGVCLSSFLGAITDPICVFHGVTVFDGKTCSLYGDSVQEVRKIQAFPFENYKVYDVPKLGSFYIDYLHDTIKRTLSEGHLWESNIVELIRAHAKQGTIAVDLGSHIGTHLVSMSKAVGENGIVIGFEPQIKLFSELVKNMELNQCHNVRAYRCAVGRNFGRVQMQIAHSYNEGGTAIGSGGDFAQLIPLDSLKLDTVSLIKIDVEGYEDEVLAGACETIRKSHPYIIIELVEGDKKLDAKRDATIKNLQSMGYVVSKLWGWDWFATPCGVVVQ
jgi:FkbM family methyltransferase